MVSYYIETSAASLIHARTSWRSDAKATLIPRSLYAFVMACFKKDVVAVENVGNEAWQRRN